MKIPQFVLGYAFFLIVSTCSLIAQERDNIYVKELSGSASEIVLIPYEEAYPDDFEDMRRRVPDVGLLRELTGKAPEADIDRIIGIILEN